MSYNSEILTSIYGRRIGLQIVSTAKSGGIAPVELLVGPEALRLGITTAESTGTNVKAWGVSFLPGTSAASSSVYTLDPPIPGVQKTIVWPSTGDIGTYLKTANSETIKSTVGSSFTVIKSTAGGRLDLIGGTTAIWYAMGLTSGTTSNASGFSLTTTT